MTGAELKVRDRETGKVSEAFRLGRALNIRDVEGDRSLDIKARKGAILVFDAGRNPDWPESRIIEDVFGPDEADEFERRYEIVGGDPEPPA